MITNGKKIANGTVLSTQVCIVGSGPAGITLAWYLQKAGVQVILIEGSRDVGTGYNYYQLNWPDKVLLYNGEATGQFTNNEPEFLIQQNYANPSGASERERSFGGTSTHWGGQSRPYDPIDFEGVSSSYPAWPITREDLDPFYREASSFCNLSGEYGESGANFDAEYWAGVLGAAVPKLRGFDTEMYQFVGSGYLNFATRTFDDGSENGITIGETSVEVILNASLLEINHENGGVNYLNVASMSDENPPTKQTEFTIKAVKYVIAMGAVANARQLLLAGVNNDNIGRYFMGHPVIAGYLSGVTPINVTGTNGSTYLTDAEQNLMAGNMANGQQWKDSNGVYVQGRFIPNADVMKEFEIGRCWFWGGMGGNGFYFGQAQNPDSQITLIETLDPVFNQKEIKINWAFTDADKKTYNQVTALYQDAVKKINPSCNVSWISWEQLKSHAVVNGHHLGTTRMSNTSADGVVNTDLRSHDLENLYVAGSSVWPSCGISNPTFTIITLSIRLADHLIKTFFSGTPKY